MMATNVAREFDAVLQEDCGVHGAIFELAADWKA
jgi:hypothetical protein